MTFGIVRHAARNVLPKSANLTESDATGGPALLSQGARQAHSVGSAFRLRYLNATTCATNCLVGPDSLVSEPRYGLINSIQGVFNSYNTLIRSSGLDRTISTARAFLDGVFPSSVALADSTGLPDGQQVVPVYALGEDPLIRGYTACPAYIERLSEWYSSAEFADKEAATNASRAAVAAVAPQLDVSLANWFNVWDGFLVNRDYNVGTPMPPVDDATFEEMQELAFWLETAKMRSDLTSNLLGGLLVGDVVERLKYAEVDVTEGRQYQRLLLVAGHYNTQLGLLAALKIDQLPEKERNNVLWLQKAPEFAAFMAFELHATPLTRQPPGVTAVSQQSRSFAVRLVAQDGADAQYTTIPLPCANQGDAAEQLAGAGACTLQAFYDLAEPVSFSTTEKWCEACGNEVYPACKVHALQKASTENCGVQGGGNASGWQLALAATLPALAVGAIAVAAFLVYRRPPSALTSLASWYSNNNSLSHQSSSYSSLAGTPSVTPAIEARLQHICDRHAQLVTQLGGQDAANLSHQDMAKLNKEESDLESVVQAVEEWKDLKNELASLEALAEDSSEDEAMRELAREERALAAIKIPEIERALLLSLLPRDSADERGVVLEVRAGTGGDEACLFAGELFRMYERYTSLQNWKFEVAEYASNDLGGCKLASATVSGGSGGIYGRLKFESGVHRVQRVPATESGGRVHTSAASVAVLPQAEDVDIEIKDDDLRIDVYRAGGAGGQHVNTTNSAVRVTHLPTGLCVAIQDERSQHKNKAKALSVLRARLFDAERRRVASAESNARKQLIGSGDRSERVRTYNFPQGRVTDHRIGVTEHGMEAVLHGEKLDSFIEALRLQHQADLLSTLD